MGIPTLEPDSERARRSALLALDVLDTAAEPVFDALARLAARLLAAPIALVSLVDADRQWFKANVGLDGVTETPRDVAFCDHAIRGSEVLVVPDAAADPRFEANPLVTAAPGIRFYAGAPLELEGGHRVGTLCVIDRAPRALGDHERDVLVELAACVTEALVMRRAMADGRRAADAITALDARLHRALAFQERSARLAGVGGWELDLATGEMVWGFGVRRILAVDDAAPATLDGLLAFFEPEIREPARGWLAAAAGAEPRVDSERWLTSATGDRRLVRVVGHVEPGPRGPRLVGAMQ
ncbi:MAG: GAF domain-containing protein, partial [Myxococcales bacterium]|nr:GAF domain-containing protein [Myxococcales bacterium]